VGLYTGDGWVDLGLCCWTWHAQAAGVGSRVGVRVVWFHGRVQVVGPSSFGPGGPRGCAKGQLWSAQGQLENECLAKQVGVQGSRWDKGFLIGSRW